VSRNQCLDLGAPLKLHSPRDQTEFFKENNFHTNHHAAKPYCTGNEVSLGSEVQGTDYEAVPERTLGT